MSQHEAVVQRADVREHCTHEPRGVLALALARERMDALDEQQAAGAGSGCRCSFSHSASGPRASLPCGLTVEQAEEQEVVGRSPTCSRRAKPDKLWPPIAPAQPPLYF